MASIYKPTYTKKDPSTGERITRKARKWYVQYKDASGRTKRVPGYTDKSATLQLAAELERKVVLESAGLISRYDKHTQRPLLEHLNDYRRHLETKGDASTHVGQTISRIHRVIRECRFATISDLDAGKAMDWLAAARKGECMKNVAGVAEKYSEIAKAFGVAECTVTSWRRKGAPISPKGKNELSAIDRWLASRRRKANGISVETSNHYLRAIKGFGRWLLRDRRAGENPFAHLSILNAEADRRHDRRTLSDEEFIRLIDRTYLEPAFRGLSGEDRALLYLTAAYTGLRAGELASLHPSGFALDTDPPVVKVHAAYSKRRRQDTVPLRRDFVEILREWLETKSKRRPCWPGSWCKCAATMLRSDLHAADIPYKDEDGLVFDFHGLRHQFISNLARSGVHPKVAQSLARHSTITLTMNRYTHLGLFDLSEALDALPEVRTPAKKVESNALEINTA